MLPLSSTDSSNYSHCIYVGKNVLIETIADNSFKAENLSNGKQLLCKVFPISRYMQIVAVYCHLPAHVNLNEITETVFGEARAYVFFDQNYGNMHTYVQTSGHLCEEEASRLFHQIVAVVAHCHKNDVVLHDLKLKCFVFKNKERTNLMLYSIEDAFVMDKGDDSISGKHGCPVYACPEGLQEQAKYSGKAANVWSLGIILYAILVGRYPFCGSDHNILDRKIRKCRYSLPETLSSKAKCLIQNILYLDPSKRLTAQDILHHPWFSFSKYSQNVWRSMFYKHDDQIVPDLST